MIEGNRRLKNSKNQWHYKVDGKWILLLSQSLEQDDANSKKK